MDPSVTANYGGVLAGTNLTKTGDGTLAALGANTYTGDTLVSAGTLQGTTLLNGASTTVGAGATLIVGGSPTTISQNTLTVNGNLRTDSNTNFNAAFTPGTAGAVTLSGSGGSALSVGAAGNAKVGNVTFSDASGGGTISDGGNLTAGSISNSAVSNTGSLTNGKNAVTSANRIILLGALSLDGSVGNTTGKVTLNISAQGQTPLATVEAAGLNALTNRVGTLSINNDLAPINPPPVGGYTGAQRSYRASLDLNNNDLVINSATLADVTDMIRGGQNGTTTLAWTGNGLRSSYAATGPLSGLTGLGVVRNDSDPTTATVESPYYAGFSGISGLSGGEILVKYTWYGDFDLNGKVDAFDFALLDAGFTGTVQSDGYAGWFFGDANLNGKVDAFDFALLDAGFSGGGSTTSLPEPSTFILAALGIGTLLVSRRGRLGRGSVG